ncbi:MAG: hypothetical protein RR232_06080 [Clostridia bacterium]
MEISKSDMRAYILDKFTKEGDFEFMVQHLPAALDAMMELDEAYTTGIGDGVYDDDDAYDAMFTAMQQRFPDYKIYCMRLCEDYLDFAEEYLVSIDAIEWE